MKCNQKFLPIAVVILGLASVSSVLAAGDAAGSSILLAQADAPKAAMPVPSDPAVDRDTAEMGANMEHMGHNMEQMGKTMQKKGMQMEQPGAAPMAKDKMKKSKAAMGQMKMGMDKMEKGMGMGMGMEMDMEKGHK